MSDIQMNVEEIVRQAHQLGASDVHLIKGLPPYFRVVGRLVPQREGRPLTEDDCDRAAAQLAGCQLEQLKAVGEVDLARTMVGRRVRVNLFRQQGSFSAAIRLLADEIPALEKLDLPPKVLELTDLHQGLVLVTGETGSGKSTTLAAMIDKINHTRAAHVLTLEDPVEYQYAPDRCIFNQREIGQDTVSFASALRAALREDPDIILVGEMRDRETIETAMTAAETGHLVLGTLHTNSAVDTIDRIVDAFPADRQQQIRVQLSMTLQAVLSQQLLPTTLGTGRTAACELLVVTAAVRNQIREGKTPQIAGTMAVSAQEGSVTMDASVLRLYQRGRISAQVAVQAARDKDFVKKHLPQSMGL